MCQPMASSTFLRRSDETKYTGATKQSPREIKSARLAGRCCPRPAKIGSAPQKLSPPHGIHPSGSSPRCPIRSRFLRRIGVGTGDNVATPAPPIAASRSKRPLAVALREPLKAPPTAAAADEGEDGCRRAVSFAPYVGVRLIPRRDEYPDRIRARLWSDPREMCVNAARNAAEFAYEDWDWRNCVEEGGMLVCGATGELVHPAHFYRQLGSAHYHRSPRDPFLQKSRVAAQRWSHC